MKKLILKNLIPILILLGILFFQLPRIMNNFSKQGLRLEPREYRVLTAHGSSEKILFPPADSGSLTIFWATWCAPCKLEMKRIQLSVEKGTLPREKVFAINLSENEETIRNFLKEHPYPFIFIDATNLIDELKIEATPTTLLMDKNEIISLSTGLSLIGIWRAEWLLSHGD